MMSSSAMARKRLSPTVGNNMNPELGCGSHCMIFRPRPIRLLGTTGRYNFPCSELHYDRTNLSYNFQTSIPPSSTFRSRMEQVLEDLVAVVGTVAPAALA